MQYIETAVGEYQWARQCFQCRIQTLCRQNFALCIQFGFELIASVEFIIWFNSTVI